MNNLWKVFSTQKVRLKEVQALLNLPELKIIKSSSTHWLSQEQCIRAIRKEFPALIMTVQQLYEASGDAEAYRVQSLPCSFTGVAATVLLCEILNLLASFMQRKTTDFSRLKTILASVLKQLKSLKLSSAGVHKLIRLRQLYKLIKTL